MFGQGFNLGFFADPPCFTDTTDIFKDNSGIALYTLDYDASSGKDITTNTLQILGDTSCIATYMLNGSSADLSGNYNGTDTNITYTSSHFGQSASFNGSSSFITLPGNMLNSLTAISASAWVYRRTGSSDNYEYILSGGISVSGQRYGIAVNDAGSSGTDNKFYITDGATTFHTNTVCNYNTWYHVVYTWSGTELKFYVNGSLDSTFTAVSCNFQSSGNGHKIGEYHHNGNYEWEGEIDQVRIFNKAISASEVTTLYNEIGERNGTPANIDFGVGGKSLYGAGFNGSNSTITLPAGLGSSGNRSRSFWINVDNLDNAVTIFYLGDSGSNAYYETCSVQTNGKIRYQERHDTSTNSVLIDSSSSIAAGRWYNVVYVFSGSVRTLYINGVQEAQTTSSYATVNNIPYPGFIGSFRTAVTNTEGKIDQVRLFNKALSSSEISKLYGNGAGEIACEHTATTTDVNYPVTNLAYYKLDNNSKDSGKSRGKFNQGVTFIGNSAGIVNTTLQLSSTAHSVSLWMKPQDLTATKWQIMFFSAFNGYPSFTLGKRPDKTTSFHYRNESSQEVYFTLSNANTWYHVVVTRNNSGSTVYVNGSSVATDSNSMGTYGSSSYQKASIGSNPLYPAEYFDGTLDQIRVYNVALTATDVANLYNNETTTTADTLSFPTGKTAIATYKLDGDGVDISGNYSGSEGANIVYGYDGSDTNVDYAFGKYGQAAVFNGSNSKITFTAPDFNITTYSLSFWINAATYNQSGTSIINMGLDNTGGAWSGIAFGVNANRVYYYGGDVTGVGGTGFFTQTGTTNLTDGAWTHIAVVVNGTAITGYINGTQDSGLSRTLGANITYRAGSINTIGVRQGAFGSYGWYNGSVDQFKVFSSALSSAQITQLYNEKPETDTSNFKTVLWKGNGSDNRYISNVGFNGGLIWTKTRNDGYYHNLQDTVRGPGANTIFSNRTEPENGGSNNWSNIYGYINSFEANGWFTKNGSDGNGTWVNKNNYDYVAWVWKGSGFQPSQTFSDIKTQGLIAHWNATQTDSLYPGSTWYDLTSNNRDLTHYKTSISNISIGKNNGGTVDMSSTRQFYTSQFINDQTFTIGGWFYRATAGGASGYENLWSQGYSPSVRLQIYGSGGQASGNRIYHYLNNGSSGPSYDTGIDAPVSAWFHIMVTYDLANGTVKLYLNGALVHTQSTITGSIYSGGNSDAYFRVARNSTNANGYINGSISQIRVYSDVLTAAEVLNDYNATKNLFQTNNNGSISATVDANQDAGFSIVKYTGNGTAGTTVGHGLSAKPQFILFKNLDTAVSWIAYDTINNVIGYLDLTDSLTDGRRAWAVNNTDPTNTLVTLGNNQATNAASEFIMYCWHSVAGYSKIGSYTSTGSAGLAITGLGFAPSFVMIKNISDTGSWIIHSKPPTTTNPSVYHLRANSSAAQDSGANEQINFDNNGFTLNGTGQNINHSHGDTYLYMAFK